LKTDVRQVLVTKMLDGEPDHIEEFPKPTLWPLIAAITTTGLFIGSIFTPWAVVWGSIPVAISLIGWFWPKEKQSEERAPREVKERLARQQQTEGGTA
jgi:cytochrome c oxidase subunit 1